MILNYNQTLHVYIDVFYNLFKMIMNIYIKNSYGGIIEREIRHGGNNMPANILNSGIVNKILMNFSSTKPLSAEFLFSYL